MSESVEWEVIDLDSLGRGKDAYRRHNEGAQSRFGLSVAQKIEKSLGPPWMIVHYQTMLSPKRHEQFLKDNQSFKWSE